MACSATQTTLLRWPPKIWRGWDQRRPLSCERRMEFHFSHKISQLGKFPAQRLILAGGLLQTLISLAPSYLATGSILVTYSVEEHRNLVLRTRRRLSQTQEQQ